MSLNEIFDGIFIVSMDCMPERFLECSTELIRNGITKIEKQSGVIHNCGKTVFDREMGCKLSHIEIVKKAKKRGYRNIFIFEDDALFIKPLDDYINKISEFLQGKDWDLFYLGGNHQTKPIPVNNDFVICTRMLTTHAYGINSCAFDEILRYERNELNNPIDGIYADIIQKRKKSYALNPRIVTQKECFSYIRQRVANYDKYLIDDKEDKQLKPEKKSMNQIRAEQNREEQIKKSYVRILRPVHPLHPKKTV